jgi:transposase-like protein
MKMSETKTQKRGRPSKFSVEQTQSIVERAKQDGVTIKSLADEMGCSTTTIRNVLKRTTS